jgi:hypothetical protein
MFPIFRSFRLFRTRSSLPLLLPASTLPHATSYPLHSPPLSYYSNSSPLCSVYSHIYLFLTFLPFCHSFILTAETLASNPVFSKLPSALSRELFFGTAIDFISTWSKSLAAIRQADSDLGVGFPRPCHVHRLRLGRVIAIDKTMAAAVLGRSQANKSQVGI